ncbi:MAG: DUF3325 family protein [Acidobacteriota bacterium]
MLHLLFTLCLLLGSFCLLGGSMKRHWPFDKEAQRWRQGSLYAGCAALGFAIWAFYLQYGWEVGAAWLFLWAALATLVATFGLSLRPRWTVLSGAILLPLGLLRWLV